MSVVKKLNVLTPIGILQLNMPANKELRAAITRAIDLLKEKEYIAIKCKPHSKVVDYILSELSSLGSSELGEETKVVGRSIDPLTVVAMLARGESPPSIEEGLKTKPEDRSIPISKMAEQYAIHAAKLDKSSKELEYELLSVEYPGNVFIRRLAWSLQKPFGVYIVSYDHYRRLDFYGTPNSIRTCKMTLDVLLGQIQEELNSYTVEEKEQFCQEFGTKLNLKNIISEDEWEQIKKKYCENYNTPSSIDPVNVEEKVAERAKLLAEKVLLNI